MVWAKRIGLFLLVNLLVLVTISITTSLLHIQPYLRGYGIDYYQLMLFSLIWGMAGSFISLALSRVVAKFAMGVRVIDPSSTDPRERELLNTVYNLTRAAGIRSMPQVGIYNSMEVNAFATGPSRNRALVAVSAGLLQTMGRAEIEGVLGHEITHIANGDMVTLTLIQGIVNAFVIFFARAIAYAVSQGVREDMRYTVRFGVTLLLDIMLSILGSMVVAAFSRWREFRADRGGARLAGTGKMIAALEALKSQRDRVATESNQAIAAFKISGRARDYLYLFSTHPPLDVRIERLRGYQG